MVVNKGTNPPDKKQDFVYVAILSAIAAGIGVYLIATTVLIAKDSVFYIERAQRFSSDLIGIIKAHPPGYPFLIFVAHKLVSFFSDSSSIYTWIYSAQSVTLLCRILSLIPLYFIGKTVVGPRSTFLALLVLIFLPYPTEFGSDALRDWPHILFLASGFWALLWGAKQGKWWIWGLVGLSAGLGYLIRHESAQLVVYGLIWLTLCMFRPKPCGLSKGRTLIALALLLVGFAIPAAPYMKARGEILPPKLKGLISSSYRLQSERSQERNVDNHNSIYAAASLLNDIVKAIGKLIERISEHLMYFFVPALLIGIYSRLRKQSASTDIERFFMPAFIVLNVIMMILLYCNYRYISRRHCLPLVVFGIFYLPVGLELIAGWIEVHIFRNENAGQRDIQRVFLILLCIGLVICVGKLGRIVPLRAEKQSYLQAAQWLKSNTTDEDKIGVFDTRVGLYSKRKSRIIRNEQKFPDDLDYIVKPFDTELDVPNGWEIQKKFTGSEQRAVVYKRE